MDDFDDRPGYRRSGRVAWFRFLLAAGMTLAIAAVMAWVLFLVFDAGWYYVFVAPALAALPVMAAAYAAVSLGHCRNRWVAGLFGFTAAVVLYLGYFHAHLISLVGLQALHRLDLLPQFIAIRMANDVAVEDGGQVKAPDPIRNWLFSGFDFLVACAMIAAAAVFRSGRAYCENCGRWMRQLSAVAAPGTGRGIARLVEMEALEELPAVPPYPMKVGQPCTMIDLEYCPSGGITTCPAFLTVKENTGATLHAQAPQALLDQVVLQPEEVEILAERVESLRSLLVTAPGRAGEEALPAAVARPGTAMARVEPLPAEVAGDLSWKVGVRAVLLSLAPVVSFLSGVGLLVWGSLRTPWVAPPGEALTSWLMLAGGAAATLFGAVVCWTNVDYFNYRYGNRLARRTIARRGDAAVAADDPDAIVVDVVPRAHWTEMVMDKPSDRGLLRIDLARRELVFEGMKERYRIPAAALLSCDVEQMGLATGRWAFYAAVVKACYPRDGEQSLSGGHRGDEWEIPLLPRPVAFRKYYGPSRLGAAGALCDRIRDLMDKASLTKD